MLDAGCGSGVILSELAGSFGRVLGLDLAFGMLSGIERGAPTTRVLLGDMRAIPLPDRSVDVAICRGSLCHVDDMPAAVRELERILEPGGVLVVSEPSTDSLALRVPRAIITRRSSPFKPTHRACASSRFRRLFREVGLGVVRQEYFGYLAFPLCGMADLIPILPRLPARRLLAAILVAIDRRLAHVPLVDRQAWHVVLAAWKDGC